MSTYRWSQTFSIVRA